MTHGRFITFEGGEGVGKSTQAQLLAAALIEDGCSVVLTREPGGTLGAEAIRALLLDRDGEGWTPQAEALLFAAARADHVSRVIRPALAAGSWVICDRFLDSSRAYQAGAGTISDEDILILHRIGSGGLLPDRTILLEADAQVTAPRLTQRDGTESDRIGGREAAYHEGVARRFALLAESEPSRFVRICANESPERIHDRVMLAIVQLQSKQP